MLPARDTATNIRRELGDGRNAILHMHFIQAILNLISSVISLYLHNYLKRYGRVLVAQRLYGTHNPVKRTRTPLHLRLE